MRALVVSYSKSPCGPALISSSGSTDDPYRPLYPQMSSKEDNVFGWLARTTLSPLDATAASSLLTVGTQCSSRLSSQRAENATVPLLTSSCSFRSGSQRKTQRQWRKYSSTEGPACHCRQPKESLLSNLPVRHIPFPYADEFKCLLKSLTRVPWSSHLLLARSATARHIPAALTPPLLHRARSRRWKVSISSDTMSGNRILSRSIKSSFRSSKSPPVRPYSSNKSSNAMTVKPVSLRILESVCGVR